MCLAGLDLAVGDVMAEEPTKVAWNVPVPVSVPVRERARIRTRVAFEVFEQWQGRQPPMRLS